MQPDSSLISDAATRLFDLRDRAVLAQEQAMSLLNVPSAADIERLSRRMRSLSQRMERIEDGLDRVERQLAAISDALAVRAG